jgi:Type III restriction enzyme, res subunit
MAALGTAIASPTVPIVEPDQQYDNHEPVDYGDSSAQSDADGGPSSLANRTPPPKQEAKAALEEHHQKTSTFNEMTQTGFTVQDQYVLQNEKIIDKAREYQQELFERAKEENIIAVLDTGMGKTLIAAMLIRHILEEDLIKTSDGKCQRNIFFLANRSV